MTVQRKKVKGLHVFAIYEVVQCGYELDYILCKHFDNFYKAKDYYDALSVVDSRRFVLVEYK